MQNISRHDVVAEARTWRGTPFLHQGRVKKTTQHAGGCDCIGLIAGVAKALNLASHTHRPNQQAFLPLTHFDKRDYPRMPDGQLLQHALNNCLTPIATHQLQPADVLLFTLTKQPQHVAMVTRVEGAQIDIIHAYMVAGKVVEHRLDTRWMHRITGCYQLPHIHST